MADGYLNFDTKINEQGFNTGINKLASIGSKGLATISKAMTGTVAAIGVGAGAVVKSSLSAVASLEQNVGGVETLFKDSADAVIKNANRAYTTAGMSANDYMSTVTSFSASLLQSLGNDTVKAAEYADTAIRDMSDNANKMGTNMQDIQNAYQGFAKQNYTMLDNLKLGYGGTKTEMERLLKDAEAIKAKNGEVVDYSIDKFGDIVEAIHIVQDEMGITGTTSAEAADTIEGSINSAKAAWDNFLAGVATSEELVNAFWIAAGQVLENLEEIIPRLGKTGLEVVGALADKIGESFPAAKGFADAIGSVADKLSGLNTEQLLNLGKMSAVLVGTAPSLSILGKATGEFGSILNGVGDISGGVIAKLGKMPSEIKTVGSKLKSGAEVFGNAKDAILLPFEGLPAKLSSVFSNVTNLISSGPFGKIAGDFAAISKGIASAFGQIGSTIASKIPQATSVLQTAGSAISGTFGTIAGGVKGFGSVMGDALGPVLSKVSGFASQFASYLGIASEAFSPILQKAASFVPQLLGFMNMAAVVALVVAGLGLLYSQFGDQIDQILLMVQTKGPGIITNLCTGITNALPQLIEQGATLINNLMTAITANIPAIVTGGISIVSTLIEGIASQLPSLIPVALTMILTLVSSLLGNLEEMVDAGIELLQGLAEGVVNALPQLINKAPVIIGQFASTVVSNLPKILAAGVKILVTLASGLVSAVPQLISKIPSIISQIKSAFTSVNWGSVGINIIQGIASGVASAAGSLVDAAVNAATNALEWVKSKLGIHSPSRVFRDEVGKMMALGMGIGFEKNIPVKSMSKGVQTAVDSLRNKALVATSAKSQTSVDRFIRHPEPNSGGGIDWNEWERRQRKINKERDSRPIFLGTKRIDYPLPKGAVPQV